MVERAVNFSIEENDIVILSKIASAYSVTVTELIKKVISEYLEKIKKNPFYRLTANVEEVSSEENSEILEMINNLSDEDLTISSVKKLSK